MRIARSFLLLVSLAAAVPVLAQDRGGTIQGTVTMRAGGPVYGVTVEVTTASAAGPFTTITDGAGRYCFPALAPGMYRVAVQDPVLKTADAKDVRVDVGRHVTIDFSLVDEKAADLSRVSLPSALLDPGGVGTGAVFSAADLRRSPNGVATASLAWLAPGVYIDPRFGLSVQGANPTENRVFVDGIETTSALTGSASSAAVIDETAGLLVQTGGFAAEHRASPGAVLSIATTTGGNRWQAAAGFRFSSSRLTGDPRPVYTTTAGRLVISSQSRTPFSSWQPVFTGGGPLLADRVWVFGSYMPVLTALRRNISFTDFSYPASASSSVVETRTYTSRARSHLSADSITARLGEASRFRFAANVLPSSQYGSFPAANGPLPVADFGWADYRTHFPWSSYSATFDLAPSNRFLLDLRIGGTTGNTYDEGFSTGVQYGIGAAGSGAGFPNDWNPILAAVQARSLSYGPPTARQRDKVGRFSAAATATMFVRAHGEHQVKFGAEFDRVSNDVLSGSTGPLVTFLPPIGAPLEGVYGTYQVTMNTVAGNVNSNRGGLFVQDTWTPTPRATLQFGVRADRDGLPAYAAGYREIAFGFRKEVAPRLGFAYDLKGDGRWIARASWGIYYDSLLLNTARTLLGGATSSLYRFTLDTSNLLEIGSASCVDPTECPAAYPGTLLSSYTQLATTLLPTTIDPALKPARTQQLSVGIDHQVNNRTTIGGRYVRTRLTRALDVMTLPGLTSALDSQPVGVVYLANPGEGLARTFGSTYPAVPSPKRHYDAAELTVSRRLANRWQASGSYTFSRLFGNYPGYTYAGGPSSYVSPFSMFDANGQPAYGRLDIDRPHTVKAQLFYEFPTRTVVGVNQALASGLPISRAVMVNGGYVYLHGRPSDGRTDAYSQTDLLVQQEVRLSQRARAEFSVNVINVFDQKAPLAVSANAYTNGYFISASQFFGGMAGLNDLLANAAPSPLFGKPLLTQDPRGIRLQVRVLF